VSVALEERAMSQDDLLAMVVKDLPCAMTHSGDAQARLEFNGRVFQAGAEGPVQAEMSTQISVNDRPAGRLSIGYIRPHPSASEGPFFGREREILDGIARTIGLGLGSRESFAALERLNAELEAMVARRTRELEERNREMSALLQSIPDMVVRIQADGTVVYCQKAKGDAGLARLADAECAPAGGHLGEHLHGRVEAVARRAIGAAAPLVEEVTLEGVQPALTVELRASPAAAGECVVFIRDITERKRLEAEMAVTLEKQRQITEMKTRFISTTSHEFRAPMAAAMISAELLRNHLDRLTPERRDEMFGLVVDSLARMGEMLDDLLLLNRMDAGRVNVSLVETRLRELVQSIIDEARLGDRGAHPIVFECAAELAPFVTDPNLLRHIGANLLSNAARYSPPGRRITVRLRMETDRVVFEVEDQGIGVPVEDRERIFEPFERGSNVGETKGTGLGLNIVKRMAQLLGGAIRLHSTVGQGSRFWLELPRRPAPLPPS